MSNSVNLNQLLVETSSLLGDATVGSATETIRKTFAINMAKNMILSSCGLPASEIKYQFPFTENVAAYSIPFGYVDKIMLRYDETKGINNNNQMANRHRHIEYVNPQEFYTLQYAQANDMVYWSVD